MNDILLRISKAENGFVLSAGSPDKSAVLGRSWIAKDALDLARVIVTQIVLSEMQTDVSKDELDAILGDLE